MTDHLAADVPRHLRADLSIDQRLALKTARAAIEAMAERGIDISGEYPKPWTDEIVQAAGVVVTILDDPAGRDVDGVRPIRDEIGRRVRRLLGELEVPIHA